ncbi:alkaline phosphatase family protein [Zobellia sp. 1_MG-2023]|uniref:alkaline phosphatase family protein n=1 Tax=Zobellia sp. 1_MG-2023 TaxID=3062626 RepID=UPI0026E31B4B|nr:alkaline phosphatase family protein [Zobellia sp. 1_MG-2023]MDO6818010.1 alkaline phosphatase family protein [Zobellia sp. 1_MG-2023]
MKPIKLLMPMLALCGIWSKSVNGQESPTLDIEHVVVIGFDGLSPDGLQNAVTPTFDKLMQEGAYSLHARAVLPTSSSTNWASMIMGAGPEQHGITSNAWEKDNFTLPAVTQSEEFIFPTIFQLTNDQIASAEIGAIYHWGGFGRLFEKSAVDYDVNPETEDETAVLASSYIKTKRPKLTFVHFDHVDHAGHEYGHGTPKYYKSVEKADQLLKQVLHAIAASGLKDKTLIIVSADHGGLGKGHGGESLKEIEIPFIVWGKGVKKNHKINLPVYQYDNAATVAFALGLKTPHAWIGKPVLSAFEGYEIEDDYMLLEQLKEPLISPKADGYKKAGGLFAETTSLKIENPNAKGVIRYTLDGSLPTKTSNAYKKVISLTQNTVIKSAMFTNEKISSPVAEAYFRIRPKDLKKPVKYEIFYEDQLSFLPALGSRKPNLTGNIFEITSDEIKDKIKSNTVVRFTTQIRVDQEKSFRFYVRSDDGSQLFIDNELVVDNDGDHGVRTKDGSINLTRGLHTLKVLWFNGGGDGWLDVFVEEEDKVKQILTNPLLIAN